MSTGLILVPSPKEKEAKHHFFNGLMELSISTFYFLLSKFRASVSANTNFHFTLAFKPPLILSGAEGGGGLVGLLSTLTFAAQKKLHSDKKDERIATQR